MKTIITALAIVLVSQSAIADVWYKDTPSNKVNAKQALALAKANKQVFRCQKVTINESTARQKKVKGSDSFHSALPDSKFDASLLYDGPAVKCSEVAFSIESGSFKKQ